MRLLRIGVPLLALVHVSCSDLPFDAVSISPIYGWVDGCIDVKVSGHSFGDDVSGSVGGHELEGIVLPDPETEELAVGFLFYARVPAIADGEVGFADVEVTSGGETDTIKDGFYFVACPATAYEEFLSTDTAAAGDAVTIYGCTIDASAHKARVGTSADLDLTSVCGTSQASFTAPKLPEGSWYVGIFDLTGAQVYPDAECDITLPAGSGGPFDSGNPDPCAGVPALTYGGAA